MLICLESECSQLQSAGLVILNNTTLDFFSSEQRAELFRLKALFLAQQQQRGGGGSEGAEGEDAGAMFSQAVQTCPSYGKAWLSWGRYTDQLLRQAPPIQQDAAGRQALVGSAVACYLEAVNTGAEAARLMLPRVLQLALQQDTDPYQQQQADEGGSARRLLEKHGPGLPEWVWLPWLPNLLQLLLLPGGGGVASARPLLQQLASKYPQALFYGLRAAAGAGGQPGGEQAGGVVSQLLQGLKARHALLGQELEALAAALTQAFEPAQGGYEEEQLLWRLHGLQAQLLDALHLPLDGPLPDHVRKALAALASQPGLLLAGGSSGHHEGVSSAALRDGFLADFHLTAQQQEATGGLSVGQALERLKAWEGLLLRRCLLVGQRGGGPGLLHCYSARLAMMRQEHCSSGPQPPQTSTSPAASNQQQQASAGSSSSQGGASTSSPSAAPAAQASSSAVSSPPAPQQQQPQSPPAQVAAAGGASSSTSPAPTSPRPAASPPVTTAGGTKQQQASSGGWWEEDEGGGVEVPGQYWSGYGLAMPHPEVHARLLGLAPTVDLVCRDANVQRRLCFLGNDGRRYHFLVAPNRRAADQQEPQTGGPPPHRQEEGLMQLHWLANRLLERHVQAQRRFLQLPMPVVVPLSAGLRLVQEQREVVSLGEVLEAERLSHGRDPLEPVRLCRERCSQAAHRARQEVEEEQQARSRGAAGRKRPRAGEDGEEGAEGGAPTAMEVDGAGEEEPLTGAALEAAVQARVLQHVRREQRQVCREVGGPGGLVARDVLLRFVTASQRGDPEAIWAWRRTMAAQLALASLLTYMLAAPDTRPHRLLMHRHVGRVVATELRWGQQQQDEEEEGVPFRLTPNLVAALSPSLLDGVFCVSMAAAAQALSARPELLEPFLTLMLHQQEQQHSPSSSSSLVSSAVQRVADLAPQPLFSRASSPSWDEQQSSSPEGGESSSTAMVVDGSTSHSTGPPGDASSSSSPSSPLLPVDHRVMSLMEQATSPDRTALMPPTWHPWL